MSPVQRNRLLATCAIFFLIVNTAFLYEEWLGAGMMLWFMAMVVFFIVLAVILLGQLLRAAHEGMKDRSRLVVIGALLFVLTTSFFFPFGMARPTQHRGDSLLVASREGAANCRTTLWLGPDHRFEERDVCFGVSLTKGRYRLSGDTIFFEDVELARGKEEYYSHAVIRKPEGSVTKLGDLVRYRSLADTMGHSLWISKNELPPRSIASSSAGRGSSTDTINDSVGYRISPMDSTAIQLKSEGVTYSIDGTGAFVQALGNGKIHWKADIIGSCGIPTVGEPAIRHMTLRGDTLIVTYGKHSYAAIDKQSGAVTCLGAD